MVNSFPMVNHCSFLWNALGFGMTGVEGMVDQ